MGEPSPLLDFETALTPPLRSALPQITLVDEGHSARTELESFIEDRFRTAYRAEVTSHYPLLARLDGPDGAPRAAAGVRFAEDEGLFLEQYLDRPIETEIARAMRLDLDRRGVVEIGALASVSPPATLRLFIALASRLSRTHGRRVAVATVRPDLARLLMRSGFALRWLAAAEPSRLADGGRSWGTYYRDGPQVFAAEIRSPLGLAGVAVRNPVSPHAAEPRRLAS